MVLKSTVMNKNEPDEEDVKSSKIVVNMTNFNHQELEDFFNVSEKVEHVIRERRCQRKRSKTRSNTMVATMTREEIFESTNIDDDQYLEALERDTTYDPENSFVNSIENLMKYFNEEVNVSDDSLGQVAVPYKKFMKGKVASVVASLRNKCNLTTSSLNKSKSQTPVVKTNIQELKKKYQSSIEDATITSPSPKPVKIKCIEASCKTKVKQMASLFNNKINAMIKTPSPEPQTPKSLSAGVNSITSPTFSSTPKLKTPKLKIKFPTFAGKLSSPRPSPFFKRKQLHKSSSVGSLNNSPLTKRKQMSKQSSTTCIIAENAFFQLTVKDKILLYNKFIQDMSNQNPKFSKHAAMFESNIEKEMKKGEVICEKQNSVKNLKNSFEAKLGSCKNLTKTLQRFKRSNSKLSLNVTPRSKEYEDILQTNIYDSYLEDYSQDPLHLSTLTVVLKSSPESRKYLNKNKSEHKTNTNVTLMDNGNFFTPSSKRTQSMIYSSSYAEPFAPPKKIRRTQDVRLCSNMIFQNQHLEELFYYWLKANNGVAFDIIPVYNKNDIIEIVPKNSQENVIPPQEVNNILEAAINKLESNKNQKSLQESIQDNNMNLIKNTMDSEESLDKSVIEVELPLEVEIPNIKIKDIKSDDSDLGVTCIPKTTSEDSHAEFKANEVTNIPPKLLRKKKLRRFSNARKENITVESDSDCKSNYSQIQCCTLPKTKKCSNYVKKLIFKTVNPPSSFSSEQRDQLNIGLNKFEMDAKSIIKKVNSPSKIKTAYTLTVISSPSRSSESDCYDADLIETSIKKASKSWPSLVDDGFEENINILKHNYLYKEFDDLTKLNFEENQQKLLIDSFIDQGFETGSNYTESPLRLSKKAKNCENLYYAQPAIIRSNSINGCSTMTSIKEDLTTEDSEEGLHTPNGSVSQDSARSSGTSYPFDIIYKSNSSQFWIKAGDFMTAIAIQHYDSEYLLLLREIFVEKSLEFMDINFGIDDQSFCLNKNAPNELIIEKVPKDNNFSYYWFSTGDVLVPFRGKRMTTKKIHSFFNYIRDCMEEIGSIKFGIDDYEFSKVYQQTQNSTSPINNDDNNNNNNNNNNNKKYNESISRCKTSEFKGSYLNYERFKNSVGTTSVSSDDLFQ